MADIQQNHIDASGWIGVEFSPDAVLPAQFHAAFAHGARLIREKGLMLAVLQNALEVYQQYLFATDDNGKRLFAEAATWINSTNRSWPFSFENICDVLELDASYVRSRLRRWRIKQLADRH